MQRERERASERPSRPASRKSEMETLENNQRPMSALKASPFPCDDPDHQRFYTPEHSPAPKNTPSKAIFNVSNQSCSSQPPLKNAHGCSAAAGSTVTAPGDEMAMVLKAGPEANRRMRSGDAEEGGGEGRVVAEAGKSKRKRTHESSWAALGFRVLEAAFCLVSFTVMAADRTQGWSGDSFDRYKEYRYCLSVAVIAFVYSGFQACDLAFHSITEKHVICHRFRRHFVFFFDQVLAYLLASASSAAATRVDDWQSNWGKDEFTKMASASIGMSFCAFAAFAISSLISGYDLCMLDLS